MEPLIKLKLLYLVERDRIGAGTRQGGISLSEQVGRGGG